MARGKEGKDAFACQQHISRVLLQQTRRQQTEEERKEGKERGALAAWEEGAGMSDAAEETVHEIFIPC